MTAAVLMRRVRTPSVGLYRLDDLAQEAQGVDVTSLSSSKGGAGMPVPPSPTVTWGD